MDQKLLPKIFNKFLLVKKLHGNFSYPMELKIRLTQSFRHSIVKNKTQILKLIKREIFLFVKLHLNNSQLQFSQVVSLWKNLMSKSNLSNQKRTQFMCKKYPRKNKLIFLFKI